MSMAKRLLTLSCAATMLSGCNLAPDHARPVGAVPAELPQGAAYPDLRTDSPDVTAIAWRDFFVEPRLRTVIELGLENSRDLRIAAANVLQARALYRVERADLLPALDLSVSHQSSRSLSGQDEASVLKTEAFSVDAGVSAFELDLFGRVRNLSRAALEEYLATREARQSVQVSLIGEIASAYLTLAADKEQLAVSRETLESFRLSLELTRAQFAAGVVSELEVRQAETLYQGARNDIAALTTQIAQDANALNLLVGAIVPEELLPERLGDTDFTLPELPADLSSEVLLRRPDVLASEHQLIAQEANIGAARAAMFPTISLTSAFGFVSNALSGLFKSNAQSWNVTPSASFSIFDFGRNKANLRYAEASREAAIANYEKTLQTAFREVSDALATRGTIREQIDAISALATSAIVAAQLSDARYRAGVDSFLVALDSQRTAYAARQDLVAVRLARAENLVQLYRTLGGGLH